MLLFFLLLYPKGVAFGKQYKLLKGARYNLGRFFIRTEKVTIINKVKGPEAKGSTFVEIFYKNVSMYLIMRRSLIEIMSLCRNMDNKCITRIVFLKRK